MLRIHRRGDMKYSIYRALALATFALAVQGNPTIDKIVSLNNRVAREGVAITESPFVAQIRNVNGSLIGSGAILNFLYILTTASCVNEYETKDLIIVVGSESLENGTSYTPSRIVIHEGFNNGAVNDIAIIKLGSYLRYSKSVRPSSIHEAWEEDSLQDGSSAVTIGWGDYSTMRMTNQTVISIDQCNESYSDLERTITADHICVSETNPPGSSKQSSDKGSPLVQDSILIGLKSWSTSGRPDGYTRLHPHLLWIEENNLDEY